jgi:hypothetical protein
VIRIKAVQRIPSAA